jgi:4,5-dihydroxyphthalate decarboxylase
MPEPLSIAIGRSDRTQALLDGRVTVPGYDCRFECPPFETMFTNAFTKGAYAVSELSFSNFMRLSAAGTCRYLGLPVFPSRSFRHSAWYVRADGPVRRPEDLRGRRVGVREYSMTAALVARGVIAEEHGVQARDIHWIIGDVDTRERDEIVPNALPDGYRIEALAPGQFLVDQLLAGEIDALLAYKPPKVFGDGRIVRLLPDYEARERAAFARTGVFPIMHLVGIRRDVAEAHPGLPAALLAAFTEAKDIGLEALRGVQALPVALPWLVPEVARLSELMGADWWPYGIARNRAALETITRQAFEQGLLPEPLAIEALFHPSTLGN